MTAPTLTHANGVTHPALPLSFGLQPRGPVGSWPRTRVPEPTAGTRLLPLVALPRQDPPTAATTPDSDTTPSDTTPPVAVQEERLLRSALAALSRLRAPNGDTVIAWSMTGSAAAVILFAAIVSYSHIHGLATSHYEDSTQAHLLPLSIDGVIAEASLVLLFAARHKLDAPWLARAMLWTGIVATLAANAVVALPPSWISPVANAVIGAVLSAWPAAAFIASVELAMLLVRDVRAVATGDTKDDSDSDSDTGGGGVSRPRRRRPPPKPHRNPKPRPAGKPPANHTPPPRGDSDAVAKAIREHPAWKAGRRLSRADKDTIAKALGVTRRTIERRIADIRKTG